MDNKEFDEIIKKKLDALSPDNINDGWDVFKQKWDDQPPFDPEASLEEEDSLDEKLERKIKDDMQNLRMPNNSKHWIRLKEHLELEALFKKRLFVAKSIEILILSFLVISVLNVIPIQQKIYQIPIYDTPMVTSIPVSKITSIRQIEIESTQSRSTKTIKKSISDLAIRVTNLPFIKKPVSPVSSTDSYNITSTKKSTSQSIESISIPLKISLSKSPIINTLPYLDQLLNTSSKEVIESSTSLPMTLLENIINPLEFPIRPIGFPDIDLFSKNQNLHENTYISVSMGPKVNLINSPFDPVYKIEPYSTLTTNFNIAVKVQKEVGPVELYVGLGYHSTSYEPKIVKEKYAIVQSEYNEASLENIKFKTVSIPIGIKYNMINNQKFQFYATAGVDLNIIGDSEYKILDVPFGRSNKNFFSPTRKVPPSESLLSLKEFNRGIFNGESLKNNIYATASIGLGINKSISPRTGIFIEPTYNHFVSSKGIGPNLDKVHTISVDVGVRYQLN